MRRSVITLKLDAQGQESIPILYSLYCILQGATVDLNGFMREFVNAFSRYAPQMNQPHNQKVKTCLIQLVNPPNPAC